MARSTAETRIRRMRNALERFDRTWRTHTLAEIEATQAWTSMSHDERTEWLAENELTHYRSGEFVIAELLSDSRA